MEKYYFNTSNSNNSNTVALKTKVFPRIYFNKMYAFLDGYYTIVSHLIDTKINRSNYCRFLKHIKQKK